MAFWGDSSGIIFDGTGIVDCATCPCGTTCSFCTGSTPQQIQVTLAGFDNEGLCGDCGNGSECDSLNGTYTLDIDPDLPCAGLCEWVYFFPACKCSFTVIRASIEGGALEVRVNLVDCSDFGGEPLFVNNSPDTTCAWSGMDVPYSTGACCLLCTPTCTVTAL
jgi:hypothetical protein